MARAIRVASVVRDGDLSGASGRCAIRLIRDADGALRWYCESGSTEVSGENLAAAIQAAQDAWGSAWDLQWGRHDAE